MYENKLHFYNVKCAIGELLAFHLSRLLNMTNIPMVTAEMIDSDSKWIRMNDNDVQHNTTVSHDWSVGDHVAAIQWITTGSGRNQPVTVQMPPILMEAFNKNSTVHSDNEEIQAASVSTLVDIVQWGDMVIFDYLTGHYDRSVGVRVFQS